MLRHHRSEETKEAWPRNTKYNRVCGIAFCNRKEALVEQVKKAESRLVNSTVPLSLTSFTNAPRLCKRLSLEEDGWREERKSVSSQLLCKSKIIPK